MDLSFQKKKQFTQAGIELGQAQLKLGLWFTSTNFHHIDQQETLKRQLATNLLFTAPNSNNQPYFFILS